MAVLRITKTGFSEVYSPRDGAPRVQIILVHGLQGHPYNTWKSDPAKHSQDDPSNRMERGILGRVRLKSKSKEKGKQTSTPQQTQDVGEEGRSDVQQNETTGSAGSYAEESLTVAIDDEKPFKKTDIYWPLDLLAEKCPQARICVYGYDTRIAGYERVNKNTLYQIATDFLHELPLHRAGNLPLIFIAHSLGGLVVKEALILSSESRDPELRSIVTTTAAVVFMGTPHNGSKQWASKGDKARKIAKALFMDNNPALLDTLGLENGDLFRSTDKFTQLWEESGFTVKTYMEDRSFIGGEKIVPDESSRLGNLKEQAITLAGNHSQMCKFNGKNDTKWLKVGPQLERYYKEAMASGEPDKNISTTKEPAPEFLEALHNVDLADAEHEIALPIDGTCEWIFDEKFISWVDESEKSTLFCIHGSLGSGKSTLMRHVVMRLKNSPCFPKKYIASFFINGSPEVGVPHKTPAEIYQSLLVQLLRTPLFQEDASELFNAQKFKMLLSKEVQRYQQELCEALKGLFRKERLEQTIIFIDAVDKCTDLDALVQFFQDIAPMGPAAKLKIWFTSQQTFPMIDSQCEHIAIENFNHDDISSYVENRLPVGGLLSREQGASLQQSIKEKASGIFLWVVLVVSLLRGYLSDGRDASFLHTVLDDTPKQLTELYHNIIVRSISPIEYRTMMHVMQWILFSARPLTFGEWHHVFAFIDNPCLQSIDEWKCSTTYTESDSLLLQRIKRVCCGLVDVKDLQVPFRSSDSHSEASSLEGGAGSFESHQYIDVIHSSVHEFFLDHGLAMLDPGINDASGEGHAYILEVCIRYCFLKEMKQAFKVQFQEEIRKPRRGEPTKSRAQRKADIFEAKVASALQEADSDSSDNISLGSSAGASIRTFRSNKSLLRSRRPEDESKRNSFHDYIKSTSSPSLVSREAGHRNGAVLDYVDGLEQESPEILIRRDSNTSSASTTGSLKVVDDPPSLWQYCKNMLVYHAIAAEKSRVVPRRALDFLLSQNITAWAATRKDMQHGATLAYFAAQWNLASWLRYFGPRGIPLNLRGGLLGFPIIVAAKKGNLEAFEYLVTFDEAVDFLARVDSRRRTALHYAAMSPSNISILSCIRELEIANSWSMSVIVNKPDKNGQTALHLAALHASDKTIKELLSLDADVDSLDRQLNTPLHLACLRKEPNLRICETLVGASRFPHRYRNIDNKTALDVARERGHSEIVLYLESCDYSTTTTSKNNKHRLLSRPHFLSDSSGYDDERTPLVSARGRLRQHIRPTRRIAGIERPASRSYLRSCFCCF